MVAAPAVLLTACGSLPSITVDSDPPGAAVRAAGRDMGRTPVRIAPDDAFPPRFVGGSYRASGVLEFSKPGCKPYQKKVNDAVLSRDIKVRLECDPALVHSAPAAAPSQPVSPQAAPVPADDAGGSGALSASIRQRLEALESLHRDRLVSDSEYQAIRKRILEGL
jgi:hypothetical protein